jgi:hypothetical protein
MPLADWGVAHDPARFYDNPAHATLRPSLITRIKWQMGVHLVNHRIEKFRDRTEMLMATVA